MKIFIHECYKGLIFGLIVVFLYDINNLDVFSERLNVFVLFHVLVIFVSAFGFMTTRYLVFRVSDFETYDQFNRYFNLLDYIRNNWK